MCGIAGFTHNERRRAQPIIREALERIRHRGPDQQGIYESDRIALGAVRLKIIDLHGGDQPIHRPEAGLVIAFNGEIYNHAQLREELVQLGYRFQSHCDTEVVLAGFAEWGVECFKRLRGMFALAIWSECDGRLILARDRLGIKPLYYSRQGGQLYFASELKALWAHPNVPRVLSEEALGFYLQLNYVPQPYTLAEQVWKLPPGYWLEFSAGGELHMEPYWQLRFSQQRWTEQEAVASLDGLLRDSVREHLVADVPLGIWASGGLDSSAILHYAAQQRTTSKLKTFSISFQGRSFDESRFFRALASHYGTEHHEFDLSADVDLPAACHQIAYYSDEPSADAGALPVYFLSQMSRLHVTVALSGEGADEIFGGYQTYLADRYAQVARTAPRILLRTAARLALHMPVSDEKIGLDYKLTRFLQGTLLPADHSHFYWNGTFPARELRVPGAGALISRLRGVPTDGAINRYMYVDQHYYLPDDILYKCDRMSMAHSLEVRPPFLDHRIVEFAASLPSSLKIRGSCTKVVLRRLLQHKLPPLILERPKEGLDIPAHEWLRGPLRPLVDEALSTNAGVLPHGLFRSVVERHMSRRENLGYHLWGLVTLHLWMKRWRVERAGVSEGAELLSTA